MARKEFEQNKLSVNSGANRIMDRGRNTPFFSGYGPQFFFGTTDITGVVRLMRVWR
jgi:translation elongation factor EF-Tu-like GTPase